MKKILYDYIMLSDVISDTRSCPYEKRFDLYH